MLIGGSHMFRLSRYWNRVAYFVMKLGRRMIWDQTGKNRELLAVDRVLSKYTETIMCDK